MMVEKKSKGKETVKNTKDIERNKIVGNKDNKANKPMREEEGR